MSLGFTELYHADWSKNPRKRWVACAQQTDRAWAVSAPVLAGDDPALLDRFFARAEVESVLVGFDFPIGLPERFGERTTLANFLNALSIFGTGEWEDFYRVAETRSEITCRRPFYPRAPGGTKQQHLFEALGVSGMSDLLRRCDEATSSRRRAAPLFWTLGANQVGRAAITGWDKIVAPAKSRGALIWPFDGCLHELSLHQVPVIAETYPAEAYSHVGIKLRGSKRYADARAEQAQSIFYWASDRKVMLDSRCASLVATGFKDMFANGEDAFDALIGLLSMIDVVDGRRTEGNISNPISRKWEGWILGQEV